MGLIPKNAKRAFALAFLLVINVIQAGYDVITAHALSQSTVHPSVFAFLRAAGAALVLSLVMWWKERGRPDDQRKMVPDREDVGMLIAIGALAVAGHINLTAMALAEAPAALVGMFAPVAPAFALAIAFGTGLEVFSRYSISSWLKAAGATVTLAGGITIAIIASSGESDLKHESKNLTLGIAFLFAAKLCSGSYPILQKMILHKYRSHMVAAWMYIYGTAALAVGVVPLTTNTAYWQFDVTTGLALLYAIVLASAVNYLLIAFVNKRLTPVILTASYPTECILAPAFAYIFLGQTISLSDGVGGGIIIAGLVLTVIAKYREAYSAAVVEVEVEGAVEGSIVVEKDGMLHLLAPDGSGASVDVAAAAAAGKAGALAPATSVAPPTSIAGAVAGAGGGFAVLGGSSSGGSSGGAGEPAGVEGGTAGLLPSPSPGPGGAASAAVPPSPLLGGGAGLPGSATPRFRRKVRAASRIFLDDAGPLGEDEDSIPVTSLWVGPAPGPLGAQARALGAGALARRGAIAPSVAAAGGVAEWGSSSGGAGPGLARHGSGGGSGSGTGDFAAASSSSSTYGAVAAGAASSGSGGLLHARIPIRNVRPSASSGSGGSVNAAASAAAARSSLMASSLGGFPLAGAFGSAPNIGQGASLMAAHAAAGGGGGAAGSSGAGGGSRALGGSGSNYTASASIAIRRGAGAGASAGGGELNLDSVLAASLPERMGGGGAAGLQLGSSAPLASAMPPHHVAPRARIESADAAAPLMGAQHGFASGEDIA